MSTATQTTEQALETTEQADEAGEQALEAIDQAPEATEQTSEESGLALTLELSLGEAQALHAWLLKPAGDGTTALDDPLVNRTLAKLGRTVEAAQATVNVRRELAQSGLAVDHLSDEQVRELARRVTHAALPGIRD
jgi:hypothetical protein